MEEKVIEQYDTYEISLVEFVAPNGRLITSFFKVVLAPNKNFGVYDTLFDARDAVQLALPYKFSPATH